MVRAKRTTAFPVGLYGMLLFALAWLTLPKVFAPLERLLVGAACWVPRCTAAWMGEPVSAAGSAELRRLDELGAELARRVERHDLGGAAALMPIGDEPIECGVLSVERRRGGAGLPCELRLDHSYAELQGCREVVTKGDALIGFLLRPGTGRAVEDGPDDPARVMLCNHRDAPRVYAALHDERGDALRFVVRPGAAVDPAPLRVELWNDPFRASRIDEAWQEVRTRALAFGPQRVPGGLLLGHTRIWGYQPDGIEEPVAIGVFVVPPFLPQALSHVVLWRQDAGGRAGAPGANPMASTLRSRRRVAARIYDLPGARHGRHLLVVDGSVPDGAAVVQDSLFFGTARGLSFGTGLVTSFVASRQDWSLLLMPDGTDGDPIELRGRVMLGDGGSALLHVDRPDGAPSPTLQAGYLFTGSNGRWCPAGLWIGRAVPDPVRRDVLQVTVPVSNGPRLAEVYVAEVRS